MGRRRAAGIGASVFLSLALAGCGGATMTVLEVAPDGQGLPANDVVALPVAPICVGVPLLQCRDMASSSADGPPGVPRPAIARITVRCTGVCTRMNGEGTTRIDHVDGTTDMIEWGYASGGGQAPPEPSGTIASDSP